METFSLASTDFLALVELTGIKYTVQLPQVWKDAKTSKAVNYLISYKPELGFIVPFEQSWQQPSESDLNHCFN